MDPRPRRNLVEPLFWAAVGALAGLAYMPFVLDFTLPYVAARFAAQGVLVMLPLYALERWVRRSEAGARLRRLPFAGLFAIKTALGAALIIAALGLGALFIFPSRFASAAPLGDLARDTVYVLAVAALAQEILLIQGLIGGRVLLNLVLGRYHRPLTEDRTFLVLDVDGSTALAERLGGEGAHALLSRLFADVADVTDRFGGETHAYVGDQVIVTWPLRAGRADPRPIACCLEVRRRVVGRAGDYRAAFGHAPEFRIGLHAGPVVAGECGGDRRQIVYFGDAINVAARLQESCKALGVRLLISGEALGRLSLPPGWRAADLGEVTLRGRQRPVRAWTAEPEAAGMTARLGAA